MVVVNLVKRWMVWWLINNRLFSYEFERMWCVGLIEKSKKEPRGNDDSDEKQDKIQLKKKQKKNEFLNNTSNTNEKLADREWLKNILIRYKIKYKTYTFVFYTDIYSNSKVSTLSLWFIFKTAWHQFKDIKMFFEILYIS